MAGLCYFVVLLLLLQHLSGQHVYTVQGLYSCVSVQSYTLVQPSLFKKMRLERLKIVNKNVIEEILY